MSRSAWKGTNTEVRKSPDFGSLTVTMKDDDGRMRQFEAFGEYYVTVKNQNPEVSLTLAVVSLTDTTCAIFNLERQLLFVKKILTLRATDVTPRTIGFIVETYLY
jgi:hypothetical protein